MRSGFYGPRSQGEEGGDKGEGDREGRRASERRVLQLVASAGGEARCQQAGATCMAEGTFIISRADALLAKGHRAGSMPLP